MRNIEVIHPFLTRPWIQIIKSKETTKKGTILVLKYLKMIRKQKNHFVDQICGLLVICYLDGGRQWSSIRGKHSFRRVSKAVARIIALALDLDADFFDKREMLGEPIATLRLLYYEGNISTPAKGIYGAGAHSDYGLLTLLATDDVAGLQICKDKDAQPQIWEFVAPLRGAFIVNLGDMLERWSNCIFRSTLHRVMLNGQDRYSVAYFVEPNPECLVECLPSCHSEANPPKFPPVTCGAYMVKRYKETHADLSTYKEHETSKQTDGFVCNSP
ncbi:kihadalactone A synthase LFS isoform X3 [Elaeis guineensis]|uniref:2-oxoglutarate-Fe(II) type oxidoreductase hxnY isoform X2 n=1 Tax=Elaeis guineensis var. tenera TaxID=51953 RepID=A0A6J0PI86_ELAGV|nr:2-oxoglutarate-Fe(II) type oxidoreductase hxnY isoform X2 [Elaeis guineensis]